MSFDTLRPLIQQAIDAMVGQQIPMTGKCIVMSACPAEVAKALEAHFGLGVVIRADFPPDTIYVMDRDQLPDEAKTPALSA